MNANFLPLVTSKLEAIVEEVKLCGNIQELASLATVYAMRIEANAKLNDKLRDSFRDTADELHDEIKTKRDDCYCDTIALEIGIALCGKRMTLRSISGAPWAIRHLLLEHGLVTAEQIGAK